MLNGTVMRCFYYEFLVDRKSIEVLQKRYRTY